MVNARELQRRVLACPPLVTGTHAGPRAAIVTATATGPLVGVLVGPTMIVVGVLAPNDHDPAAVSAQVRTALAAAAPGVPVSVSIRCPSSVSVRGGRSLAHALNAALQARDRT